MILSAAIWLVTAPAGYLAGDVYNSRHGKDGIAVPIACALLPPMAAFIAIATLLEVSE